MYIVRPCSPCLFALLFVRTVFVRRVFVAIHGMHLHWCNRPSIPTNSTWLRPLSMAGGRVATENRSTETPSDHAHSHKPANPEKPHICNRTHICICGCDSRKSMTVLRANSNDKTAKAQLARLYLGRACIQIRGLSLGSHYPRDGVHLALRVHPRSNLHVFGLGLIELLDRGAFTIVLTRSLVIIVGSSSYSITSRF